MYFHRTILAVAAAAMTAACGDKHTPPPASAAADSMAAPSAPPAQKAPTLPSHVDGFQNPESAKYDAELDVWYVSNVNGDPTAKDGNGFISRLKGDGTIDSLKFIEGGRNEVTLNGPKGMALVGDTLWVADIDVVRGFNRNTGQTVATVDLKGKAKFLNDAAAGPDGIYVTDTGVISDGKGGLKHVGPDQIFRIAPDHKASVAIKNDSLAGPNGIAWDGAANRFIVGPFIGKTVVGWTPGQKTLTPIGETKGSTDGLEVLGPDRFLITSWADSSLFILQGGKTTLVSGGISSPADIGVDTKRHRVAIPQLLGTTVQFRDLPAVAP